jgi:hypothetical protein
MPFKGEDFKIIHREESFLVDSAKLTPGERAEFDYLPWDAIDAGTDSATFVRWRGDLYDLGSFMRSTDPEVTGLGWHGRHDDTFFSAVVIYLDPDGERAITGLMVAR